MVNGFFPTPYPDECYYSILCRYFVRCGSTSNKFTARELFGNMQSLSTSIFFPIRLDCIDRWTPKSAGITREMIVKNHTMLPYMAMMYSPNFLAEMNHVMNGEMPAFALERIGQTKSLPLWPKYLRYCPQCAGEDKIIYGEAYWHRIHQLPGMVYCTKHFVRLENSQIPVRKTTTTFYPASNEIVLENTNCIIPDDLYCHKESFLRIGKESEWLLNNGMSIDWDFDFQAKYKRLLREMDIATVQGISDYDLIVSRFNDYWGEDFLELLYTLTYDTKDWIRHIQAARIKAFKPIYHILLMCFLRDSVKSFLEYTPSENPFGEGPWPCENPLCAHYHVNGCQNTEIRYINGVATGFFLCDKCGMLYKQTKCKGKVGNIIIVEYGDVWEDELLRCLGSKKMTVRETARTLKCKPHVVSFQKKKMRLRGKNEYTTMSRRYDAKTNGEAFYKAQVLNIYEQYREVTFSMLRQLAPGAYSYLSKHAPVWLHEYLIHESERTHSRVIDRQMLKKVRAAVEWIKAESNSDRQLTYGYVAGIAGVKEHELKYSKLKRPQTRAFLDTVIESKEDWIRRRIVMIWQEQKQAGKPISFADAKCKMSLKPNTYIKYKNFIGQLINELNLEML